MSHLDLKPCPFCGMLGKLMVDPSDRYSSARVVCSDESLSCPATETAWLDSEKHQDKDGAEAARIAADAWNGRA